MGRYGLNECRSINRAPLAPNSSIKTFKKLSGRDSAELILSLPKCLIQKDLVTGSFQRRQLWIIHQEMFDRCILIEKQKNRDEN